MALQLEIGIGRQYSVTAPKANGKSKLHACNEYLSTVSAILSGPPVADRNAVVASARDTVRLDHGGGDGGIRGAFPIGDNGIQPPQRRAVLRQAAPRGIGEERGRGAVHVSCAVLNKRRGDKPHRGLAAADLSF